MSDFDPTEAFKDAFNDQLSQYPPDTRWLTAGRPSKAHPHGEDIQWWWDNGPAMVNRWAQWRATIPWDLWVSPDGVLGVELELILTIGGELFKLRIDRVFTAGGRLIVVDLKTGQEPHDLLQLGTYKVALETQWPGLKVAGGTYWMARTGEITGVDPLTQYTPEYLAALASRLRAIREAGAFIPTVSRSCKQCSVGRFCAVNNGAEAHNDPDYKLLGGGQ